MRFLLDQGLPRSAARLLREAGDEAVHVGEIGLSRASDHEIINHGRNSGYVIVTLDADFHSILAQSRAVTPSVVRIRIEGLKGEGLVRVLREVQMVARDDLQTGTAISVCEDGIRVRRLPLVSSGR